MPSWYMYFVVSRRNGHILSQLALDDNGRTQRKDSLQSCKSAVAAKKIPILSVNLLHAASQALIYSSPCIIVATLLCRPWNGCWLHGGDGKSPSISGKPRLIIAALSPESNRGLLPWPEQWIMLNRTSSLYEKLRGSRMQETHCIFKVCQQYTRTYAVQTPWSFQKTNGQDYIGSHCSTRVALEDLTTALPDANYQGLFLHCPVPEMM